MIELDVGEIYAWCGGEPATYEQEYNGFLSFFHMIASMATEDITLHDVPRSWIPLLRYMGCAIGSEQKVNEEDWQGDLVDWDRVYTEARDKRFVVEMSSAARPEIVDFLYIYDTTYSKYSGNRHRFPVTTTAAFQSPEVREFEQSLRIYGRPAEIKNCVIVPCSADKPYPSRLHLEVRSMLPFGWHQIVATGVLGLVPEELWHHMPIYDSGLPNFQRITDTCRWYFTKHEYDQIVVYSDVNAHAIAEGLRGRVHGRIKFIFGTDPTDRYQNLLLEQNLRRLSVELPPLQGGEGGD